MNEYVTVVDLKTTLNLDGTSFADADLAAACEAASRVIDETCRRRFWVDTQDQVRYYQAVDKDLVRIDDLAALTTLKTDEDGDGVFEVTWTVNTDCFLTPLNAAADDRPYELVERHPDGSYLFPTGNRRVEVTGKFGWPAVPAAVGQAAVILASKLLRRAREAPFGVVSIGFDGAAVRVARTDPDVWNLLHRYIRGGMGLV